MTSRALGPRDVRLAVLGLKIEGADVTRDLVPHVRSFRHTDALDDRADSLTLELEDARHLWSGAWRVEDGQFVEAEIVLYDPKRGPAPFRADLGSFEVDEVTNSGPPSVARIKASAVHVSTGFRRDERSKAYENVTIATPLREIAGRHGLELKVVSDGPLPRLQEVEQRRQSDLAFASELCAGAGLFLRLFKRSMWVGTRAALVEGVPPVPLSPEDVTTWEFTRRAYRKYRACEVRYHSPTKGKLVTHTAEAGGSRVGGVLRVSRKAATATEAERIARAALAEANREGYAGSLRLPGRVDLTAGSVVRLAGFGGGQHDGDWLVTQADRSVTASGGYTVSLVLEPAA